MSRTRNVATAIAMTVLLSGAGPGRPAQAQVPVIDSGAIAHLVEQVQHTANLLSTLQQQFAQVQSLVTGATGARGLETIAGVLNLPSVRAALPDSTASLLSLSSSAIGAYGSLTSIAQSIRTANQVTANPPTGWQATELANQGNRIAVEAAAAAQIYNTTVSRRAALDELRQRLSSTADEATALQLTARINSEMSQGINDLNMTLSLLLQQQANRSMADQRQREAATAMTDDLGQRIAGDPVNWWR